MDVSHSKNQYKKASALAEAFFTEAFFTEAFFTEAFLLYDIHHSYNRIHSTIR